MSYEPPRDGYTNGYIVDVMYDNRPSKYPAVFRTYVRIPDYVELDNAEELADAIIRVKWFTEFGHLNRGDMLT
ncbi:hypothetical protein ROU53_005632, partial [Escherichia coli]|nr:hypothetical protein [Escherichia coli]